MDGVILFADDKIHHCNGKDNLLIRSNENALFDLLSKEVPVLGVNCLELAEKSIASIGTFSAVILDWEFEENIFIEDDDDDESANLVKLPSVKQAATMEFLEKNDFYSLVYIYSNENIKDSQYGERLKEKFGKRIKIEQKTNIENPEEAKTKILSDIEEWKRDNTSLAIPLIWSKTINKSTQNIFKDLSEAEDGWIKEIYDSANHDGMPAAPFVIEIFQHLLSENLIQSKELIDSIESFAKDSQSEANEESTAKLFQRVFYSKINDDTPIMTGDICDIDEETFGIISTPECDVDDVCNNDNLFFDLFVFKKDSFDKFLSLAKNYEYKKEYYEDWSSPNGGKDKKKLETLKRLFNQPDGVYHVLPSFPFPDGSLNKSIVINFSTSFERHKSNEVKNYKRRYKLNSPFIQQLRQRYISHLGRVGVPALPTSLRNFNLR